MTNVKYPQPSDLPAALRDALRKINSRAEAHVDPIGIATPLLHAQMAWLAHPQELGEAIADFSMKMWNLQVHSWLRALGQPSPDVEKPHPDDARFTDPMWTDFATWDIVKEWYLTFTHHAQNMLYETPGLANKERRRAAFWWRKSLNALAPTNFFWTNPVAQRKALETRGESLIRGMRNFLADLEAGNVRLTNPNDFHVGKNLAITPGKVVFRNRMLEVIHYVPTQARVHTMPVVIVTPWINKFYILDLTPKKSMIKYLLDQGLDVYITSWKNPTDEYRGVTFDDYLLEGIDRIVQIARELSGADKVNAVGYCIGGAALATYMAWANLRWGEQNMPVASATFLATLVDYHHPGDIEVFLDPGTVDWLIRSMEEKGYLDGSEMAASFRLLRSNSLIWHYVVHGYLYGETPPPFDVLYWNMDTTRMPAVMHGWYLREFYLENKLIRPDALNVAGKPISLERIIQPVYAVAAEDDHIAPWRQAFRIANAVEGDKRFVLSSSGHIFGIVNPVVQPPKREFRTGSASRLDTPESWKGKATEHVGSWWPDWMDWLKPMSGTLRLAPKVDSKDYPALGDAPGTYVLEP
ncbi:Polyhydroxyalkanoic acid synthase [Georgfuchsia toluolica]|uniref:Polyhydroxyalkanoic acid synthase n=2 Tax=Georgfuchsia toluolica TaxID=424218 RepID=A0A916J3D4_9PROT|nr:Polyhydroxyalkanoic acid synthase [Georgfuchsia toluolica]